MKVRVPKSVCGEAFYLDLDTTKIVADSGYETTAGEIHHKNRQKLNIFMKEHEFTFTAVATRRGSE